MPIFGIFLGFALAQVGERFKSTRRSNQLKRALLNELSAIHEIISKALTANPSPGISGVVISLYDAPLITDTYDSLRTEIASSVSIRTLTDLQSAYRFIAKMNSSTENANNFGYIRVIGSTGYVYPETESISKVDDLVKQAIEDLSGELKQTLRAEIPAAVSVIILLATVVGLWFIYWNLSWLMQIPRIGTPTNSTLPTLELSPLGAALFAATGGLVSGLAATSKVDDKVERLGLGVAMLFGLCALFLIFLKYGIVAPLEILDSVFTIIYGGVFCALVLVVLRIIIRPFLHTSEVHQ